MAATKKVFLIIVEGVSDETSLGWLSEHFDKYDLDFQVVHGDILSFKYINTKNCRKIMNEEVKKFLNNHKYNKNDIKHIFHLIDTDGVFIDENLVVEKSIRKIRYSEDRIECKNRIAQLKNMQQRKKIIDVLYTTPLISKISYSMHFMSMNLEHVLHKEYDLLDIDVKDKSDKDIKDYIDNRKRVLSEEFEEKFVDDFEGFLEFINSKEIVTSTNYLSSWNFIKSDNNSLKRYSNFNIAI